MAFISKLCNAPEACRSRRGIDTKSANAVALETPPAADVVDQDSFERNGALLYVTEELRKAETTEQHESALAMVGVRSHDA